MQKTRLIGAAVLAFILAGPVLADPNPQLVQSVQNGLAHYGLQADVSKFATSTVARLHLKLSSPEDYLDTRQELKSILRTAKYK